MNIINCRLVTTIRWASRCDFEEATPRRMSALFASCFYTMTGFHGAHVAGGVIAMSILAARSWFGAFSANHYAPVEMVGLYWHFVDLVWILLFWSSA